MFNGIMIDGSRLMERHDFYFRLVEFMAERSMDTLVLHFADDYGLALRLPGFEELSLPRAFDPGEIRRLLSLASEHGIEVIPEIETFGHTRFLTDHPRYANLAASRQGATLRFNALDPLHPETLPTLRRLLHAAAELFPGRYLHIGCDEVDLDAWCRRRGLDVAETWVRHVNRVIGLVRDEGRIPMMWADHPVRSEAILDGLRRDVVLVHWDYSADVDDGPLDRLRAAGFRDIVLSPSLACWQDRFLVPRRAFENTNRMAAYARRRGALGVVNTIWCPWRYLQDAIWYGIAWSAEAVRRGGPPDPGRVQDDFARRVYGVPADPALRRFLDRLPDLAVPPSVARKIVRRSSEWSAEEIDRARRLNESARRALADGDSFQPARNPEIHRAMLLAARCVFLCSEWILLKSAEAPDPERIRTFNRRLDETRRAMDREWDRTRFPDDPQKSRPKFRGETFHYAHLLIRRLSRIRAAP